MRAVLGEQAELLYSGGDERCARGRSAHQRGLCTSPRVGEEDEGRGQWAVANGRAKNKWSLHTNVGEMVGHDRVARRRGATKFRSVDLHSQHDSMWLGCRSLCRRTEEVGPRGHSTLKRILGDGKFRSV